MRTIGLYSSHTAGIGGGERYTYALLDALRQRGDVELLISSESQRPDRALLREAFGVDLPPDQRCRVLGSPFETRRHDLLVNLSHFRALPPLASRNLLVVFFPQILSDTVADYDLVLTISRFSAEWIRRYWGITRTLVAPPAIDTARFPPVTKAPLILSVGRFFDIENGNTKQQHLMVESFRRLCDAGLSGWRLALAGSSSEEHAGYLAGVRAAADGYPIDVYANVPIDTLAELYGRASLYWHATGLTSQGLTTNPASAEHFGITILEAMAAGAVPIIPAIGGGIEIIEAGRSGLVCRSLDDLMSQTLTAVHRPEAMAEMSRLAIERARTFDRQAFDARVAEVVDIVMADPLTQARVFLGDGNPAAAVDSYAEALDRRPSDAALHVEYAEACYRAGRKSLMVALLKNGLQLDPHLPEADSHRRLIERIEAQHDAMASVHSGASFDEDYFERGAETGVSGYTNYCAAEWSEHHAEVIAETFKPASCLEIGCAKGDFVSAMQARGVDCIGMDLSQYSLTEATPDLKGRALVAASLAALPFPDDAFELIVAIEVLEHVPAGLVDAALSELWRVGRRFVYVTVQNSTATTAAHFFSDVTHVTMKPLEWWQAGVRRAGFELLEDELPFGEFVNHQMVLRPVAKLAHLDVEAVDALVRQHEQEARLLLVEERASDALVVLERAVDDLDRAETPARPLEASKSRLYRQMALCYESLGRRDEAEACLLLGRQHGTR